MSYYALVALINGIAATFLGILVYFRRRKEAASTGFALFSLCVSFWSYSYFIWQISGSAEQALFWSRMLMAGAIFVPVTYLHFVLGLLDRIEKNKRFLIFSYILFSIFSILNFTTPNFIESVRPELTFKFWPKPGIFYHIFLATWSIYMLYSIYLLFADYKTSSSVKRAQIKYVLIGIAAALFGASTNYLLWYEIPIPPIGNILVLAYIGLTAYAILKHHLFNIKVIASEIFGVSLSLVLLVNVVLSESFDKFIIDLPIFLAVSFFAILLIRSVLKEVESKEELAKMTAELQKAYEELKVLDKAKSEFISMASHQLRTPLSAIKGYISMLVGGSYGRIPEKAKEKMKNVFESNERLIRIVNDLLDISKIEMGKMELEKQPTQIEDLLQSCYEEMKIGADKKGLRFVFEKPKYSLAKIELDPLKFRQAILNLIDNAIRYTQTPKESKLPTGQEGKIEIEVKKTNSTILISVKDTGEGLTAEEQRAVFEGFTRGSAGIAHFVEGAGLGLYVAKKFLELHKGKIWVESEGKGKGSTFYVELPIK